MDAIQSAAPVQKEKVGWQSVCLTLNRPASLNALDMDMVRLFSEALEAWAKDSSVVAVVVKGAGRPGKAPAFCAGGDIRFQRNAALADDPVLGTFFDEEYRLNHLIHCYPKPYIALMDGIVMGGGMGLSQRASLRIVTERSTLAMPETKIGCFPMSVGDGSCRAAQGASVNIWPSPASPSMPRTRSCAVWRTSRCLPASWLN